MGGSHISALKLINALDPREFRALIVLHSSKGQLGEFLRYEKIAYELAPTPSHFAPASARQQLRSMIGASRTIAALAAYLRERDVRIVHTNEGDRKSTRLNSSH